MTGLDAPREEAALAPGSRSHAADPGMVAKLFIPMLIGGAVAVSLGVYGRMHTPTGIAVNVAGFAGPQTVMVWLATG